MRRGRFGKGVNDMRGLGAQVGDGASSGSAATAAMSGAKYPGGRRKKSDMATNRQQASMTVCGNGVFTPLPQRTVSFGSVYRSLLVADLGAH